MKLIKPSFNIIEQGPGIEGIYKQIEKAAKVCYKSEGNITEDSAKPFIDNVLLKRGHLSPLEHGTVYLKVPNEELFRNFIDGIPSNFNYSWCRTNPIMDEDNNVYITTNYRHIIEHKLEDYLKYLCEPTEHHDKRVTVRFILSRSIAQEYTRHRVFSFAMESQRYCNYSTDKFSNEVTFIIPCWLSLIEGNYKWEDQNPLLTAGMSIEEAGYDDSSDLWIKDSDNDRYIEYKRHYDNWVETEIFMHSLQVAENDYLTLINQGWKPQQAREVLPNACKTELVMTGFINDWKNFFELRDATSAHPQARELAHPLHMEFLRRKYIIDLYDEANPD